LRCSVISLATRLFLRHVLESSKGTEQDVVGPLIADVFTAAPSLNLTPEEKRVFGQLFREADKENIGVVTGEVAVKFFEKTRLEPRILGEVRIPCRARRLQQNQAEEIQLMRMCLSRYGRLRTKRIGDSSHLLGLALF
jgi:hypothetical protein